MNEKSVLYLLILFLILFLLSSALPSTARQASQQEQSSLTFLIVGGRDGFAKRFGEVTPFRQLFYSSDKKKMAENVLLRIACQPLSKEQIIIQSGLSEDEFEEISSLLLSLNMITSKDGTWATTLPVLTGREMAALRQKLSSLADKMAAATSSLVPQIKNLYDQNRLPSDPKWEETVHLFISYFLLDTFLLRFLSALEEEKGFKQYYSESQKILPAFFLEFGENFTNFGCNSYSFKGNENNQSIYVFVLHGTLFERIQISLNKYEKNPDFSSALFKLIPQEGKPSLSDQEIKILEDLGWLENDKLKVPMINSRIRGHLTPLVAKAAASTAEVVFENFNIILDTFNDSPYSKFLDGAGDYIQYSYHALMYLTIKKLIQQGILPAIPKPLPEYSGTYVLYSSYTGKETGKN
jgi:hypothetical protein